jgi:hypothetical protein
MMQANVKLALLATSMLMLAGSVSAASAAAGTLRFGAVPAASEALVEGAGSPPVEGAPAGPSNLTLSNEKTLTTWAHPLVSGPIYAQPSPHARQVGRIQLETEDGFSEVYLLLRSHIDAHGEEWVQLRIPGRPNGREGWVSRERLGVFQHTRWLIVIDRAKRTLRAYYDGHLRRRAPVGVGKPSTPTPAGHFWIRERFRVSDPASPYFPYALGTSDYSTLSEWPGGGVVGIHGPFGEPQAIPGDPSHGCVRMRDADIAWLGPRVTLGTPVEIL